MSSVELHEQLQESHKLVVLDVRNLGEFEHDGRISEAILIPLQILGQRINELPKDKTIGQSHEREFRCIFKSIG